MPTEEVLATVAERPKATVDSWALGSVLWGSPLLAAPNWVGVLMVSSFGA